MLDDDAPQSGMGMDEAPFTQRDQQVMLRGSGLHQQDIAPPDGVGTTPQTIARGEAQPRRDIGVAKPVPLRICLLYTSPSPRDRSLSRMPSSA